MKVKVYKAPKIHPNNVVRHPFSSEMMAPGFIQNIYNRPLYFNVTSSVDESFIVDWQLKDK